MKDNFLGVLMFLLFIAGFFGYANNIARIWDCNTTGCRTTRVVGAITTVPGAIMGFMDFE